jgi:hypothetical protein
MYASLTGVRDQCDGHFYIEEPIVINNYLVANAMLLKSIDRPSGQWYSHGLAVS